MLLIRGISDSDLQLHEMGKLSLYARKRMVNLNFRGENVKLLENTGRRCHSSFKTGKIESNRQSLRSPRERKRNKALHTALSRHWWSNGCKWRAFGSRTNTNTPRAISHRSISPNCLASAAETEAVQSTANLLKMLTSGSERSTVWTFCIMGTFLWRYFQGWTLGERYTCWSSRICFVLFHLFTCGNLQSQTNSTHPIHFRIWI